MRNFSIAQRTLLYMGDVIPVSGGGVRLQWHYDVFYNLKLKLNCPICQV